MNRAILRIEKLTKTFEGGRIVALRGVDLEVAEGEFLAIMGPSGSGKSTLLHLIAALDRPDGGEIYVDGQALSHVKDLSRYRARMIGLVFQLHNLIPTLTALENVQVPMFEIDLSGREREERAAKLLQAVNLEGRAHLVPPKLSGGERQRVAIARALANDPKIILADEPTGNLDSQSGEAILSLLRYIQAARGTTLLLVTHDERVARTAQRTVHMLDGELRG